MALALPHPSTDLRRALDLEALLTWAIRDQMADRDNASWFEAEANVYNAEMNGITHRGRGVIDFCRSSADGCAAIASRFAVGTDVDGGGAIRGIPSRVHPDADLVVEAIERLPSWERRVILHHARHADRPDWLPLTAPLVAVTRPSDRPGRYRHIVAELGWQATPRQSEIAQRYFLRGVSLFDALGRRRIVEEERGFRFRVLGDATRQVLVKWCPLELKHSATEIAETNADYLSWHGAMTALHSALRARPMRDHALTGFTAPARPWDNSP